MRFNFVHFVSPFSPATRVQVLLWFWPSHPGVTSSLFTVSGKKSAIITGSPDSERFEAALCGLMDDALVDLFANLC